MIIQAIVDIVEICSRHNISQVVIAPGSRSAALTLAFARHPSMNTFVIPDERSAGYIALGLAQSSQQTVAVICTSGTAAANLYPAIIEAYYQEVPLLVLTADRPPEWIDQQDGQTIRQEKLYQNHVLASYHFPVSFDHQDSLWHAHRMVNEAILKTKGYSMGPVHINVPIREPFYPAQGEKFDFSTGIKTIQQVPVKNQLDPEQVNLLVQELGQFNRVMVLVGQGRWSDEMRNLLIKVEKQFGWIIIGDITSNIHALPNVINKHDLILMDHNVQKDLAPDIVITIGQSILSKGLKGFLRRIRPKVHWHIGLNKEIQDTFQSMTKIINVSPEVFFMALDQRHSLTGKSNDYADKWYSLQEKATMGFERFFNQMMEGEYAAVHKTMGLLPDDCDLHLANSMPVRYASYVGLKNKADILVWSNRGASGIDGCMSTFVGHAINKKRLQVLITGDLAFFYDRNALWHSHLPDNIRIIILNNHGGGIFRLIDGPKQQPELEEYFETKQELKAANAAKDFNLKYFFVSSQSGLQETLNDFFGPETGKAILEIQTVPEVNEQVFELFKNHFKG